MERANKNSPDVVVQSSLPEVAPSAQAFHNTAPAQGGTGAVQKDGGAGAVAMVHRMMPAV